MIGSFFTKETTPGQFLVFVVFVAVVLLIVGGVLLYLSFGQPPEKLELAMRARSWGVWFFAASFVVGGLAAAGKRFLE